MKKNPWLFLAVPIVLARAGYQSGLRADIEEL